MKQMDLICDDGLTGSYGDWKPVNGGPLENLW